jgi:nicotinate phosphoribosyltransferase
MGLLDFENRALITDLYQLTMCASYFQQKHNPVATFELFVRHFPENRGYLVFAGLEQGLEYLKGLKFLPAEVDYLKSLPAFKHIGKDFFEYLLEFKFTGEVWAMEEGEIFFTNEPVLCVRAPLIQAQLVETYLLTMLNFQSLIATKAVRTVEAAKGRSVVDFGTRRAHGPEAGVLAARAAFISGVSATSNVYAAHKLGIPPSGTMAHSYVMSFESEKAAFEKYIDDFPENSTLLIDTYDTVQAAHVAADLKKDFRAVRLDSGDLLTLSKSVRRILDKAGRKSVKIFASGDLNEYLIEELLRKKAPIDAFGVGTELVTSKDAPALGGVYKMVEVETDKGVRPTLKLSASKATYPSRKQVWRKTSDAGMFKEDLVGIADEKLAGKPLLKKVMEKGRVVADLPALAEIQKKTSREMAKVPPRVKGLLGSGHFPVKFSDKLRKLRQKLAREIKIAQGLL